MKRLAITAALLFLGISLPASLEARHKVPRYLNKESTIDMSKMNHILIGWVDLGADDWALYGYENKTDWADTIGSLNSSFSRNLVPGRTVTSAKKKEEVNASDNDLYIKFSDVRVDYNKLSPNSFHTFHRSENKLRNCHDSGETVLRKRLGPQELLESSTGRGGHEGTSGSHGGAREKEKLDGWIGAHACPRQYFAIAPRAPALNLRCGG